MIKYMNKFSIVGGGFILALSQMAFFPASVWAGGEPQATDSYFIEAQKTLSRKLARKPNTAPARNIILFIGDGMGVSTVTAARILEGQLKGMAGEENILSWETFPYTALSKTYNTNRQIPDSAGTASAFLSGTKTRSNVISVNQNAVQGDCQSTQGNHLESFLELSEKVGVNTGIVTNARLTHATPAAAYAHSPSRYWETMSDIPKAEQKYGCIDIARQFVNFSAGNGIEIAFGGGRRNFLPSSVTDGEGEKGKRKDNRNLIEEWKNLHQNGQYVWNEAGFDQLDIKKDGPILGLFNASHMQFETDRHLDKGGEPSLADMTKKAIEKLQGKSEGYFLYIEGARIDHAHHAGNAYRALHDSVALAEAVQVAKDMTNGQDTLIIVTADHSHGFVMTGDVTRGNPILGKVVENDKKGIAKSHPAVAKDGSPYTTLGYYNGGGAIVGQPRSDLSHVDTEAQNYLQQALVPTGYERHGGEDVAIYADGPGGYLFHGVVEQNYIFHVMKHALRLDEKLKSVK